MITFTVKHHVPGRIRVEVPILKTLSRNKLEQLGLSLMPSPSGIRDVSMNPMTGSVVIQYEPHMIDILEYMRSLVSNEKIRIIIEKRCRNNY
jgi:hypothetical protein